jgi:AspT/YidE/YbjL antiporter-like protein
MTWLGEIFGTGSIAGSVLAIGVAASLGLALGSIRVRGLGLGIAGVLFSGLLLGHLRVPVSSEVVEFARDLGLILFVYCVGVQVGPGFLASLRRAGLFMNALAAAVVLSGAALAVLIGRYAHVAMPAAVGLFSGATTNTPSLGAAQAALRQLPSYTNEMGSLPGLGYAVAYPFGVLGLILAMVLTRRLFAEPALAHAAVRASAATMDDRERGIESAVPAGEATGPVQALPLFIGVSLGIVLGSVPIHVRGLPAPLRLGLAAGPMIVAMTLSSVARIGPLTWRLPERANLLLREVGIVMFLACVGIRAGGRFAETLLHGDGFLWMGYGALITFLPVMVVAVAARLLLRLRHATICGLLAGSMTDPPALAFACSLTPTRAPMEAYATVYPLTQLLRALSAQLIVLLFVR